MVGNETMHSSLLRLQ